jgi:hypothetical protein
MFGSTQQMVTLVIDANVCRDFRGIHTYTVAAKVSLPPSFLPYLFWLETDRILEQHKHALHIHLMLLRS